MIGLKAPGNCSASFCSNKILVLLCEGPKPQNSMISGFVSPPLFIDFNIPNYFNKYKKVYGNIFEKYFFVNLI